MADPNHINYLQQLRATGRPLPTMLDTAWESPPTQTSAGLFVVPHVSDAPRGSTDVPGGCVLAISCALALVAIGIGGMPDSSSDPNGVLMMVALGFGVFVGLAFYLLQKKSPVPDLEISQLPLEPGQAALLMLPERKGHSGEISHAWLVLRERVETKSEQGVIWSATPLSMVPLKLNRTSGDLLSADLRIPADAVPSYESEGYQLQWCIAVDRQRGKTDYFRLWVVAPRLKAENMKYFS